MRFLRFFKRKKTIKDILIPLINWTPIEPTRIRMCLKCGREQIPLQHHKYCNNCHILTYGYKGQLKKINDAIKKHKRKENEYICDPRGY